MSGKRSFQLVACAALTLSLSGRILAQTASPVSSGSSTAPAATAPQSTPSQSNNPAALPDTTVSRPEAIKSNDDAGLQKSREASSKDSIKEDVATHTAVVTPTAFQLKAAEVLHSVPPIFGSTFFNTPGTFTPAQDIQVPSNYILAPGDQIILHIWGPITIDSNLTVDRAGRIYVPQVGDVQVAGTAFSQLQDRIKNAVDRNFRNYNLSVELGQLRSIQIFVTGQAVRPGSYTISSFSTLINALFLSGGPSDQGSYRKIQLRRGNDIVTTIDIYQFLRYGDKSKDVRLLPGDVLFIPPVGRQVAIGGSVKVPAVYELLGNESVADVVALAGGLSNTAAGASSILLARTTLDADKHIVLYLRQSEAATTVSQNGDIISVPEVPAVYDKTVTLRGNVLAPGRFTWFPGMKISDILPDKAALLTQDYWNNRNRLSLQTQFEPLVSGTRATTGVAGTGVIGDAGSAALTTDTAGKSAVQSDATHAVTVRLPAPDIDWSYAVVERTDSTTLKSTLIPFNLGRVVLDHDASADQLLQPGDIVTIFSQGDLTVARSQQTKFVRIEGEVEMAGVYSVQNGETLQDVIRRAGGLTPNAYLFGSQFQRESTRITQQQRLDEYVQRLSAELQHSMINLSLNGGSTSNAGGVMQASQDLLQRLARQRASGRIILTTSPNSNSLNDLPPLQPENGDVLIVPARPATVSVIGSVNNASSYLYIDGAKANRYLALAGGVNRIGDTKHIFVIRANGTVISKDEGHRFSSLRLSPGDTIVVPEKSFSLSKLQLFLNSGLTSQIAVVAALVSVIK